MYKVINKHMKGNTLKVKRKIAKKRKGIKVKFEVKGLTFKEGLILMGGCQVFS